jgi:hypothetical protein
MGRGKPFYISASINPFKNNFMKTLVILATFVVACCMFSGCASIIHGGNQIVDITSQPTGAMVTIDGKEYGRTPQAISLRRKGRLKGELAPKKEYAVKIAVEGYLPYEMKLKRELDAWFFGNLLFGGVIGMIIDAADGAMYKLTPNQIIAQMGPATASTMTKDGIYIAVTLKADPSWEKIGQLEKAE